MGQVSSSGISTAIASTVTPSIMDINTKSDERQTMILGLKRICSPPLTRHDDEGWTLYIPVMANREFKHL